MGSTLFGQPINTTYDGLIKTSDTSTVSATAKYLSDGVGNDSVLSISNAAVGVGTASPSEILHVNGNAILSYNSSYQGLNSIGNKAILARVSPTTGIINYAEYAVAANINGFIIGSEDARVRGNISTDSLEFITNSSTRIRITSTGFVGVNTSNPAKTLDVVGEIRTSQGILFGTDTNAANTLNDYEEGTFTPVITGSSTDGSATYGIANGEYTKIGNTVYVQVYITWSSGTGTGNLRIDGLPFTIVNSGAGFSFPVFSVSDAKFSYSAGTMISGEGQPATTAIAFVELPVGGGTRGDVAYVADGTIVLSGTYLTAE